MAGAIIFVFIGLAIIFSIYIVGDVFSVINDKETVITVIEVAKPMKHKSYDYWDDAGDGSGVNYVQMPDGSVRID